MPSPPTPRPASPPLADRLSIGGRSKPADALALPPPSADPRLRAMRRLVWLYFVLWLVEGALRKWIVPGAANPLLVIRDPVLLLLYFLAIQRNIFPLKHPLVVAAAVVGALCVFASLVATQAPWYVIIYGLRANYLHLPMIFLLPSLFDESDVRKAGRWVLLLAVPMSFLVVAQFRSPPTGWLNIGAGGEGYQLESALDHARPSGTFSFTNGLCDFTALLAAFFFYQVLAKGTFPRWLWLCGGGALTVLVTLSGSRTTVGVVGTVLGGVAVACVLRPVYWRASIKLFALGALVILLLGSFAVFREGLDVFSFRFGDEESVKKGFFGRYFGSLFPSPVVWDVVPMAGTGLGMGTNVASKLILGRRYFMAAEGEFDRAVLECGPLLGMAYIGFRWALTIFVGLQGYRALKRSGQALPFLIFCGCGSTLLIGQFAQPTELGYAVLAAGFSLAAGRRSPVLLSDEAQTLSATLPDALNGVDVKTAARRREAERVAPTAAALSAPAPPSRSPSPPSSATPPAAPVSSPPARRGRSAYAERLHGKDSN